MRREIGGLQKRPEMFSIVFHKKQRGHEFNSGLAETERCQKGSKKPMKFYAFDALYLQRLRSGDPWTEQHFSEYFSALIELKLRRRLRSPSAIEDVRQETFVRTWAAVRSERGIHQPERLGSFVNSVCNNVLLEHYRKSSKENPLCDDSIIDIADPATSVPDAISNREIREKVRDILKSLSEKDHFLLEAVFFNESDKDEICQHVGVNRDYLRVLLCRCKKSFRKVFVKEMDRLGKSKLTGAKGITIPKNPVSTRHLEWAGDAHRCSEVRQVGVVRRQTRSARHAEGQIGHERCISETHTG